MCRWIAAVLGVLVLAGALAACGGSGATPPAAFPYQPLWPFASQEEADRWLAEGAPGGHSPWHADAEATALFFTQNYLGFDEIDRTTEVSEQGAEAWVGVGYLQPNEHTATVATIHLARFGTAPDAPWEVVGTRDEWLTLETPPYGSTVGPVIEAGGTITGVDESLHLQVRQSTQETVLGDYCCVSTGGEDQPWSAQVSVRGLQPGALTLVVWTGGHVAAVERFAVTGLRTP
jgi:hypothetical protein